ncbi:MAG: MFS transporter [Clostridia bacterium]|nr:MFS transporter [Clostridia bacterium]
MINRNESLYKFYRTVGYDYLFYTVISFLFLTITKHLSVAEVMYTSSAYALALAISQLPFSYVVEKIGLKKALVLGNLFWIISFSITIFSKHFVFFVIAEIISACGTSLKSLTETQVLYASLKKSGNRKQFAKIEGASVASYYFVEALSCLFIGTLFEISNYIPVVMTMSVLIISFVTSLFFEEVEEQSESRVDTVQFIKDFRMVLKSSRIRAIMLYVLVMSGIIGVVKTLQKDTLVSLNVSAMEYSYIFAVLTLCVGLGSKLQYVVEKFTKRKNLTYIGFAYTVLILLLGIVVLCLKDYTKIALVISIVILIFHNLNQGLYRISVKKYMNNFTTHKVRGKILSTFYMCEGIGQAVIIAICGFVTDTFGTYASLVITGSISTILMVFVIKYMKKHLGLNPEEYLKEDIFGMDIKDEKKSEEKSLNVNEVLKEMSEIKK